jgi:hypothetical protein
MLYPLSYEGLRCTFAQHGGRVLVHRARAGCLVPDGLCRTCAACRGPASHHRPHTRRRLYGGWWRAQSWRPRKRRGNDVVAVGCGGRSCPCSPGGAAVSPPCLRSAAQVRCRRRCPRSAYAHCSRCVSVPKPCVASSIPAGGTTTYQEKPAWTSTSVGQGRSCVLPLSVAIRSRLPPFAKPLRNGRTAWRCPRSPGFVPLTGKTPSVRAHGRSRPSVAVDVAMDVVGALRPEPGSVVAERRDRPSTRVGCCSVSARVMA